MPISILFFRISQADSTSNLFRSATGLLIRGCSLNLSPFVILCGVRLPLLLRLQMSFSLFEAVFQKVEGHQKLLSIKGWENSVLLSFLLLHIFTASIIFDCLFQFLWCCFTLWPNCCSFYYLKKRKKWFLLFFTALNQPFCCLLCSISAQTSDSSHC